jgi:MoxR-like ATPase
MIGKQTLEGNIATGFQYGTLLKAFMEGRVCLIDEIDTIPPEVLMRVKQLFEKKSMSMYAPQENGGERKALLQTKIIATANIKSEKYTYQNQLPPQLENLFVTIEVPYLPKEEIYDFALVELMNRE